MKPLMAIGIILIIVGALALGYQGFTYFTHEKVLDAGPVQVTAERQHFVWVPPVVGGALLLGGVVCLLVGANRPGTLPR
jgi:hypothetical protein